VQKIRGLNEWLSNDPEMLNWVSYKLDISVPIYPLSPEDQNLRCIILNKLNFIITTPGGVDYVRRIRQDWSKRNYASKPENQTITFTLNPQTIKKFDTLRGKNSRRTTLEWIINLGTNIEIDMRAERRQVIEAERIRLESIWPKKSPKSLQQKMDSNTHKKLKLTNKAQEELINELLFKNSQLITLTEHHELKTSNLTEEQNIEALNRSNSLIEYHSKAIKTASLLSTEYTPD
jgi:hypothetical protein